MKVTVNKDRCKECGLCIHHCPRKAISKCDVLNANGYYPAAPWEQVTLAEGSKGPILAQRFMLRVVACRKDGDRNYLKPGKEVWLYIRKYEDGTIKYFVSDAPEDIPCAELDRAATLRWPIEQCFEECKSYLGMTHYEGRSYPGWKRHILFVMIAHLFTTQIREIVKKRGSL